MANLHGHEAGNGGYSQGEPTELCASPRPYSGLRKRSASRFRLLCSFAPIELSSDSCVRLASNFTLQRTGSSRCFAPRPLSVGVDMTSTVKYPGDARTGRAVAPLGPAPDVVDAGVIGSGTMGLCGGIPR